MTKRLFFSLVFIISFVNAALAQTKVSGYVIDNTNQPVPYANVVFKDSKIGVVTDENGKFYIESSETYTAVIVSFMGYQTKEVPLPKAVNYNFKVTLSDGEALKEVVVFAAKT